MIKLLADSVGLTDVHVVPGGDLVAPADDGSSERASFKGIVLVLEVATELGHPLEGELGIGVCIELPHGFLRFPDGRHITVRVAGMQEADQLLTSFVVEALLHLGEQTPEPVEGVGLLAAMSERLVLHSPAAPVELRVGIC